MANEFQHKDPGATMTQAEYITTDGTGHIFDSQAQGDIVYASSSTVLSRLGKSGTTTHALLNSGTNNNPLWALLPLASAVTGTLPVANGGTGITSLATGVATFLGTSSSANLRAALTDETGTGGAVFATSPTLVTPALGTPAKCHRTAYRRNSQWNRWRVNNLERLRCGGGGRGRNCYPRPDQQWIRGGADLSGSQRRPKPILSRIGAYNASR